MSTTLSQEEYILLVKQVNKLRQEVHLFNVEEISEAALDGLKHKISLFEKEYPDLISKESPNYTVAGGVLEGFEKYSHRKRMLSLTDVFDFEELKDWEKKWQNWADKEGIVYQNSSDIFGEYQESAYKYVCEPKLDGLAISLIYKNGKLSNVVTRGDGFVGEDVTANARYITGIPRAIEDKNDLEIRGEVFMSKRDFKELNEDIKQAKKIGTASKTGPEHTFKNPRNAASGTLRQLDSEVISQRKLSFVAYSLEYFINS